MMRIARFNRTDAGKRHHQERLGKRMARLLIGCTVMLTAVAIALATDDPPSPDVPDQESSLGLHSDVRPPIYTLLPDPTPALQQLPPWTSPGDPSVPPPSTCSLETGSRGQTSTATSQSVRVGNGAVIH